MQHVNAVLSTTDRLVREGLRTAIESNATVKSIYHALFFTAAGTERGAAVSSHTGAPLSTLEAEGHAIERGEGEDGREEKQRPGRAEGGPNGKRIRGGAAAVELTGGVVSSRNAHFVSQSLSGEERGDGEKDAQRKKKKDKLNTATEKETRDPYEEEDAGAETAVELGSAVYLKELETMLEHAKSEVRRAAETVRAAIVHSQRETESSSQSELAAAAKRSADLAIEFYGVVFRAAEAASNAIYHQPFWTIESQINLGLLPAQATAFVKDLLLPFIVLMWPESVQLQLLRFSVQRTVRGINVTPEKDMTSTSVAILNRLSYDTVMPLPFTATNIREEFVRNLYRLSVPLYREEVSLHGIRHLLHIRVQEAVEASWPGTSPFYTTTPALSAQAIARGIVHRYSLRAKAALYRWDAANIETEVQTLVENELQLRAQKRGLVPVPIRTNGRTKLATQDARQVYRLLEKKAYIPFGATAQELALAFTNVLSRK